MTLVDKLSLHGGAEHLALMTATRLDAERFESFFCVSRWPPPPSEVAVEAQNAALARLEAAGTRFIPLGRKRKLELAPWRRLAMFLRRERIDVLHTHKFGSNVWGALVGSAVRVPVLLAHEHTWSYEGNPVRRVLDRELIARRADRFIAVSRADRRRMTDVEGISPDRTIFIPNGIPPSPTPSGRDVRAELGIEQDAPVVGAIGVLRAQKAHHVLLRAAAQLVGDHPTLAVLIAGEGPERAALEALARELGIARNVRLLGFREDVADVLQALDVAVSCSDFEGSPLAVMEYMDAARGIVATAVGGVPDLIEDGTHGLLVAPRDSFALAGAIASLLSDPERARRMGARAQARRRTEFDIDTLVRRLEDLYVELLEQRRAQRRRRRRGS
ncbi:MAG TPA: glycosyltransferase [Solirubrobacteraceae bacterium]|nr:glycosyltransferase [Solirubrobacteraceae bacterium]